MENRTILTEQIKRLLALADEKQLRLLYRRAAAGVRGWRRNV